MKEKVQFSSEYQGAIPLVVTQQILLWLLAGVVLTGGFFETILFCAAAAYWAGFITILARRPSVPTKVDVFFIKWGTFILFVFSFCAAALIVKIVK